MIDITESINYAVSLNVLWKTSEFHFVLEALLDADLEILWEEEENWATIRINDRSVGLLWRKYPLLICESDSFDLIKTLLGDFWYIGFVKSATLDTPFFTIDQSQIPDLISFQFGRDGFSANDLWFHTVQD